MAHAGLTQRQIWEARPWRLALLSLVLLAGANCPALAEEELFVSPLTDLGGLTLTPFGQCQATLTLDPERRFAGQPTATVSYQFKGKEYGICQLRFMPAALQPDMARISCRIYGDNSSNVAELYCVDAEGEIFKRNDGVGAPEWRVVDGYFKDFRHDPYSGSQNGNRKVDWPLKEIGLQVVNYGVWGKALPQGKMSLADLKIFASPQATGKALQQAADAGGDKLLVAAKAAGITVDGRLGDWEPRGGITLDSRSCKVIEGDGAGYSAEVRAAYDARTLYVAAVVRDPEVRGDFNGHNIYQNDGIELWFDIRGDSLFSMNQPDDYQIGLTFTTGLQRPGVWVWRNEKPAFLLAGIRSVTTKTPDGYVIEAAIPLDAFEGLVLPADGQVVHFNVSLCNTGAKTFSRLLWSGSHIGHPATFGLLAFGPPIPAAVAEARQKHAAQTASFITQNGLDSHYQGAPRIVKVDAATTVGRYHKYEIDVDLAAEYANPFDYDDFRLYGEFTSPSGTIQVVDGFHVQPQRIFIYGAPYFDSLTPHGPSKWQIRFAPTELGRYTFRVVGIDRKGRRATTEKSGFLSVTSPSDGFLRVSPDDPEYLQFDSGRKFFGIGYASHFWDKTGILTSLKNTLNQLAYFGANYTSINLENNANCGFMLETGKLGWYDQESASKLDYLISIAESRKVYLIPCLNQTGLALFDGWPSNKYNQANGGPCGSVVDYFSNPEALRLIKNRTRYTVARWGYSTAILGWEIFNEVNYTPGYMNDFPRVLEFHRQMTACLRQYDPGHHLITTSFGGLPENSGQIWRLKDIDFTISHVYSNDMANIVGHQAIMRQYRKPNLGGEAGVPANEQTTASLKDPNGIAFHNILWSSMIAKCAGNILHWWPFEYFEPLDLGREFPPLVKFVADIDWPRHGFEPRQLTAMSKASHSGPVDCVLPFDCAWGGSRSPIFLLKDNGIWGVMDASAVKVNYIADADLSFKLTALPGILFGAAQPEWRQPFKLRLTTRNATTAGLRFQAVAASGTTLKVAVNGKPVATLAVKDADTRDNPYAAELTQGVEIPLEKGENLVEVVNLGPGWLSMKDLTIRNFSPPGMVENLRCFALVGKGMSILWLQNSLSTWYQNSQGVKLHPFENVEIAVPAADGGQFQVEWWNTWTGEIIRSDRAVASEGRLWVSPPPFERDIAAKIRKR